jgi:hypothetical protein
VAVPTVEFHQFATSGLDPFIYDYGALASSGYVGIVNDTSAGALTFGTINADTSTASDTKVVIMRATDMGGNAFIRNMRFWGPDLIQAGLVDYNQAIVGSGLWQQNRTITSASGTVSSTLPTTPNLLRRDGFTAISGVTAAEASQWVYLNLDVGSSVGAGNYGGTNGQGILRYRVTFDYGK